MSAALASLGPILFYLLFNPPLNPDEMCLAKNVYYEAALAKQSLQGQLMVAYVAKKRADDMREAVEAGGSSRKWGGDTVCECVFARKQFSWTLSRSLRNGTEVPGGWMWASAVYAAKQALAGWQPEGDLKFARYYMNQRFSARGNICRFKREFVFVGVVEDHQFYREATNVELAARRNKAEPAECRQAPKEHKKHHRHRHWR